MRRLPLFVCLSALLVGSPAYANLITFTELPLQPIDNLTFNGVTFDFKIGGVDSADANFNDTDGPNQLFTNGWSFGDLNTVEGSAFGVLRMDFAAPINFLQFAGAIDTTDPVSPGYTVNLFDPSLVLSSSTGVNTAPTPGFLFSEALFSYAGLPIIRAVVSFDATTGDCFGLPAGQPVGFPGYPGRCAGQRFALDNLQFDFAPQPVPEPTTMALFGFGAAGAVLARRRRARQ